MIKALVPYKQIESIREGTITGLKHYYLSALHCPRKASQTSTCCLQERPFQALKIHCTIMATGTQKHVHVHEDLITMDLELGKK